MFRNGLKVQWDDSEFKHRSIETTLWTTEREITVNTKTDIISGICQAITKGLTLMLL